MCRFIRKLILLILLLTAIVAVAVYGGYYSPVGFINSYSVGESTLLIGRVVEHAEDFYYLEDPSGSTWVNCAGALPAKGTLVIVWSTFSTSAESKAPIPIQNWRVGTFNGN